MKKLFSEAKMFHADILYAKNGDMWIGTEHGIIKYSNNGVTTLFNEKIIKKLQISC